MSVVQDSLEDIRHMSGLHDAVIVACSFGKDSMVVLDLLAKTFKRVEGFCMSYVLGMDWTKKWQQYVKDRWNIEIKEVEHFAGIQQQIAGYRCFPQDRENVTWKGMYQQQREAFGIPLIATGTRAAESLGRRAAMNAAKNGNQTKAWTGDWHPIAWWSRGDVLNYCKNNDLPIDDAAGDMHGWSLDADSVLKLHDRHHGDYVKLCQVFPFCRAVVARREFYGIGGNYS